MTNSRRYRRGAAAAGVLTSALLAGCANSSQFTAGRLPYGGERVATSESAPRDPFLAGASAPPVNPATASRPLASVAGAMSGAPAPGGYPAAAAMPGAGMAGAAPPLNFGTPPALGAQEVYAAQSGSASPYGAAYAQQQPLAGPPANPFGPAYAAAPPQAGTGVDVAEFPTAAAGQTEENPFAEIQGQPAFAAGPPGVAGSLPRITPAGATADAWAPSPQAAASYAGEEFLPPVR